MNSAPLGQRHLTTRLAWYLSSLTKCWSRIRPPASQSGRPQIARLRLRIGNFHAHRCRLLAAEAGSDRSTSTGSSTFSSVVEFKSADRETLFETVPPRASTIAFSTDSIRSRENDQIQFIRTDSTDSTDPPPPPRFSPEPAGRCKNLGYTPQLTSATASTRVFASRLQRVGAHKCQAELHLAVQRVLRIIRPGVLPGDDPAPRSNRIWRSRSSISPRCSRLTSNTRFAESAREFCSCN